MEICCLGEADPQLRNELLHLPNVRIFGGYAQEDLTRIVLDYRPHLAWLPFSVPETHSYALSDVRRLRLPLMATAIGAVAERVERRPSTWLVPFEQASGKTFLDLVRRLYRDGLQTPPIWSPTGHLPPLNDNFYEQDYLRSGPGHGQE